MFKINYLTKNSDLIAQVEDFIEQWENSKTWIVAQTSGSTGVPKQIQLDKKKMRASALMTGEYFDFKPNQSVLLCLSPATIGGKMLILRALLHGLILWVLDPQRNPLKAIDFPIDFASFVPMQVSAMLEENPEKLNLVSKILIGGAAVPTRIAQQLIPYQTAAYESFGMTETMSHVALKQLNSTDTFEALPGIHFSTEGDQLIIHAPQLGLPALKTTDVVELIDSTHFVWKGRADFVINSGGVKMHPELIEKKIAHLVKDRYLVVGKPDPLLGEKVVLFIEGNSEAWNENDLNIELSTALERYEIPKKVYFVPRFAETTSGKVNRWMTSALIEE